MEDDRYIAYIRVSSPKQGRSGLGLQAQKDIITHNINSPKIVEWYTEVYSGKDLDNLPQLIAAKEKAKRSGYVLVIAKTDRLRNTQQALDLVDELTPKGVWFCNVGKNADKFMLTLYFAFAEKERLEISIRTKAALAILKAKGIKLGRPATKETKKRLLELSRLGAHARFMKSVNNPCNLIASNIALRLRNNGLTFKDISNYLNNKRYSTPNGKNWRASSIYTLLRRYSKL